MAVDPLRSPAFVRHVVKVSFCATVLASVTQRGVVALRLGFSATLDVTRTTTTAATLKVANMKVLCRRRWKDRHG